MIVRLLLILSLIAQITFTFRCGSMLFFWPALGCLTLNVGPDASDESIQSACRIKSSCGEKKNSSCEVPQLPCDDLLSPSLGDDANPLFGDGKCDSCPPPLPQKIPNGKTAELFLPPVVAFLSLDLFQVGPTILVAPFTTAYRWLTNHLRQAWLEIWLN